jgi:hypothetical protein
MRNLLIILLTALAFTSYGAETQAKQIEVSVTKQQVSDVCGSKLGHAGNLSGCEVKCGLNGEYHCDFTCDSKTNKCTGSCADCSSTRVGLFGRPYSVRVVKHRINWAR